MTINSANVTPITLAPVADVAPHSYVVLTRTTICLHCSTHSTTTEVFAKTHLKPIWARGKYVTNLRPVRSPSDLTHNVPIEHEPRPVVRIPFCHECFDRVTLDHLPLPPPPANATINRFAGADPYPNDPKATEGSGTNASTKPKTKPTIADLGVV